MREAPKRIWLQRPLLDDHFACDAEVTWCQDMINDDDTEYVRVDEIEHLQNEIEIHKQLRALMIEDKNTLRADSIVLHQRIYELEQRGEPVAQIECDGETWKRAKLNARGLTLPNGTKLYLAAPSPEDK